MKLTFLLTICLIAPFFVKAQYTSDALLFSENQPATTARSMGVGNALGALGGDMSAANLNPAGIAVYRRMELALSVGAAFNTTKTNFVGYTTSNRLAQFSFGNAGLVIAGKLRRSRTKWKSINVGLTFNRIADYGRNFTYSGVSNGSRLTAFANNAYGPSANLDPYEGWVAYNAYLIDSVGPNTYAANGGVSDQTYTTKSQNVRRTGGVNELGITLGGNYDNKLYLAATVGIDFMNMQEDFFYRESSDTLDFRALDFTENRTIKGTGINLKIGMIYRVNKFLRMGLAIHTPTAYRLVDSYNSGLYGEIVYDSLLRATNYPMEDQSPYVLQHDLATPWTFMGSVGVVIAKKGFIGLDVSYSDYSWGTFSLLQDEQTPSNNQFIDNLNQRVQQTYQGVLKARIGGELALGIFRARLGYQFQTSPYKEEVDGINRFRHDISGGVGVRWKHFFIDFAYTHTLTDFAYYPYSHPTLVQEITGTSQTGQAMLTLGVSIFRSPKLEVEN